jgi:hypothetical protein
VSKREPLSHSLQQPPPSTPLQLLLLRPLNSLPLPSLRCR